MNSFNHAAAIKTASLLPVTTNMPVKKELKSRSFNTLGVPVNNCTLSEAASHVFKLVDAYEQDQKPKYVATLNVDFLVNALGFRASKPRHPELLEVLRSASLVTADGFPVVWLSRICGRALKERVAGSDLVPLLAKHAAYRKASLYLLGGGNGVAKAAAAKLEAVNPGLDIAGAESPFVYTEGDQLKDYEESDADLVKKINESGADILLLGLGNPKQEIWFNRNKHRLNVPVSIGVGGTFEFIVGNIKRAPKWMRQANLEWVYRMTQDPKRLVKRYVKGLFKFGLLSLPVLYYRLCDSMNLAAHLSPSKMDATWSIMWGAKDDVVRVCRLPKTVNAVLLDDIASCLEKEKGKQRLVIIDFSQVQHIKLDAFQSFFAISRMMQQSELNGLIAGIKPSLRKRLETYRIMDVANGHAVEMNELGIVDGSQESQQMRCNSYAINGSSLIYLSGKVDGASIQALGLRYCLQEMLDRGRCIIDLRYASGIDSSAAAELYKIVCDAPDRQSLLGIGGANSEIKQVMKMAGVASAMNFISDDAMYAYMFKDAAKQGG